MDADGNNLNITLFILHITQYNITVARKAAGFKKH